MPKFRKKPVVIEAFQFKGGLSYDLMLKHWGEEFGEVSSCDVSRPIEVLTIRTLEGNMQANRNDWIIKGVKGEFYPCKPEIFESTYEFAEVVNPELIKSDK